MSPSARTGDADRSPLTAEDVRALTAVTAAGGIVLFPAEGVYGLAVDPDDRDAVARVAALKQRDPLKPLAVMFWNVADVLDVVDTDAEDSALQRSLRAVLPGPIGVLVHDRTRRFPAVTGTDPTTLGVRVPVLAGPASGPAVAQTSANRAGEPDPRTVGAVPEEIRRACALVLDRGPRPGTPSTIVDLRTGPDGARVLREGSVPGAEVLRRLSREPT